MHFCNTELPGLSQLLAMQCFLRACFTLENIVRNRMIMLNLIIPKYKRHTHLYINIYLCTPINTHTPMIDHFFASLSHLSLIKGILN